MSVHTVDSLLDMSKRATARYANIITDFGELPYELMRSALLKIEKPEHLVRKPPSTFDPERNLTPSQYNVEQKCPQFIGKDRECWINFLKRDVPNWQSKPHEPSKPENWFKAYQKLKKQAEAEMSKGEDSLKAALAGLKEEREKNTSTIVKAVIARPKKKVVACPVKSMTLLQKIKHQTIEANRRGKNVHIRERSQNEHKKSVQNAKNPVTVAPPEMVNEIRRQNGSPPREHQPVIRAPRPAAKPPMHRPTRKPSPPMHAPKTVAARRASMTDDEIAKREARLNLIKRDVREDAQVNSAGPSTSKAANPDKPEGSLAKYLAEIEFSGDDKPTGSTTLKPTAIDRPRSASPAVTLPRKRKAPPPSLFMSNKRQMVKPPTKA
jgi:elongin-A